jgi:hypothetical protein
MQNEEKLRQIGASMETSPRKSFALLAEQTDICGITMKCNKQLHQHPSKTNVIQALERRL